MTTENPLSSDLEAIQAGLDEIFKTSSEKKVLALQSHEDSSKTISSRQKDFLSGLGFEKTVNIKTFEENCKVLEKEGLTMSTIKELKEIRDLYGKNIIGYNDLCKLSIKYNLYFGDSTLFKGNIPMDNIKEMEDFPFQKFASHYNVLYTRNKESIIEGNISTSAKTMIVAPLQLFDLKNVLISESRELIKFNGKTSTCKPYPVADDPIVLLPFKLRATQEIFFIVVTHWDNSHSII
jgi:hypothetical protein